MVVDASAVVEWLLRLPLAPAIEQRLSIPEVPLHAPHLLGVEVSQVVRRYVRVGDVSATRGAQALADLANLDVHHYPHEPLLPAIWRLRNNLTAYDAAYVALAELLDQPLLTRDGSLANAPGLPVRVELIQ